MWKKIVPLVFLFSIALNLAFLAFWGAGALEGRPETAGECQTLCLSEYQLHKQIGTSREQWAELEPLLAEFGQARLSLCRELDQTRAELIDALEAQNPDYGWIKRKQDEILTVQRRMQDLVVRQLLREKEVLTAEQRGRLFEFFRKSCQCRDGSYGAGEGCGSSDGDAQ